MTERIAQFVLFFPVFLFSLSFHECAHAWTANRLGDPTARLMRRMTLNPLAHIDWIGTFLFPLMMFLMPGLLLFGWAKPVPVNPRNLRGGRRGHLKVALAGPVANLLLACLLALLFRMTVGLAGPTAEIIVRILETGVFLNLMLALFNLVPIPPLDGSKVLEGVIPYRYLPVMDQLERYGFLILIAALYLDLFRVLAIPVIYLTGVLLR